MVARFIRRLASDTSAATAIYVALALPVVLGAGALSLDLGRTMILHSELQYAADAAALAAARELDRTAGAQARATAAAQTLIKNGQHFSTVGGDVTITSVNFYSSISSAGGDTPATGDLDSHFVKVATQTYSAANTFIQLVGGPALSSANASAIAGNHQTACKVAPLMMCNPDDPSFFDLEKGQMVRLTYNNWGPGAFGLLDPPGMNNSGGVDVMKLIGGEGISGCFYLEGVSLRTGKTTGKVEQGFNIRFDMYPPGSNADKIPGATPAPNVIKAQSLTMSGKNCTFTPNAAWKGMPRDKCHRDPSSNCEAGTDYIGMNDWQDEAAAYWAVNHPDKTTYPTNAAGITYGQPGFTRYDLYLWELESGNAPSGPEDSDPQCAANQGVTEVGDANRRIIYVAVINCSDYAISGNATPTMTPLAYARFFLTEPAEEDKGQILAEFIDIATPDNSDGAVHDIIQLYR